MSLDDDVAARLRLLQEERRLTLKELVNAALRSGLTALEEPPAPPRISPTSPVSLGGSLLPDVDDVEEAIAVAEGDDRR